MSIEDMHIQLQARNVLVRNWIDMRVIDYNVIGQVIYLRGMLAVTYEHPGRDDKDEHGINTRVLLNLERDLTHIAGVKAVHYDLTNWFKSGGVWVKRTYLR
jgi:hypothetical protein